MAVRLALGAGRGSLIRLVLAESIILAAFGTSPLVIRLVCTWLVRIKRMDYQIVGVVKNSKQSDLREQTKPYTYISPT